MKRLPKAPHPFLVLLLGTLTCTLFVATASTAQPSDDLATRAAAAIQASDWAEAATLHAQLTEAEPENATAWYRLGLATMKATGDTASARSAFQRAIELGFPAGPGLFGVAKTHAIDGDREAAMRTLEELSEQGPSPFVVSQLTSDEVFAPLASTERFRAIVTRLTPCASAEYRQFDFWIGSWNVFNPAGQLVGTNTISETLDGCLLTEAWESASGGQGMSINYYDRDAGSWSQIYRDNTGNVTQWPELVGGLVDGAMVLDSGPETTPRSRWIWTPQEDGRVRQMAESTTDGGETWTVVWDSYYQRIDE